MKIIQAGNFDIVLGRRGENLASQVRFPIAKWVEVYGAGRFQLIARRQGDSAPYPVTITSDENFVYWNVTSADTAYSGLGKVELQYYVDDVLAKSTVYLTRVLESLSEPGTPPAPYQSWVDDVLAAANDAEDAADRAESSARQAEEAARLLSGGTAGQVLTKNSAAEGDVNWADLPSFDGAYEVIPRPFGETTMLTRQTYLDRDVVVRAIPYQETSNLSGGKTVTIGG